MMKQAEAQIKYRKDYQPSQFLITQTKLKFQLFEQYTLVTSELYFVKNSENTSETILPIQLDGVELELLEIAINDRALNPNEYHTTEEYLEFLPTESSFTLKIQVKILPHKNTSLEGLYTSAGKFCTQCEAEGFRKITYYPDRPDIMSEFTVRIEADKKTYPLLLSNGNPTGSGELTNGRHFTEWHDPFPKPSYLFALVAGDLDCLDDTFTTCSGRNVDLKLYVDKGKLDQCEFAMQSLKAAMKWDEEKFGREYDLDLYMIVAVGDFNMGAMENKGLNIFNTVYVLANEKTATDKDFEGVESVIAHEYFHNWTGNRITCRDWFQLSLKEGLTVFRDQKFSEDMQSKTVERINQVKVIRSAQFAEDSGPMAHPIRPDSYIEMNNFYTVTVYNKGAEVIRMMHTLLGEDGFRKGMDLYFDRHDGQAVTCEDFVKSMEDANDVEWSQFRNWYRQAGTPVVSIEMSEKENIIELKCHQHCPPTKGQAKKQPFMIPIKMGLLGELGNTVKFKTLSDSDWVEESILMLTETEQTFELTVENKGLIPSLLRDFSSPVKLVYPYNKQQLGILFAHDPNDFNRWDAGQQLMTQVLLDDNATITEAELSLIKTALDNLLHDETVDNALKALAVQVPDLNSLIGLSDHINADQLFAKHKQLTRFIGNSLEQVWFSIYSTTSDKNPGNRHLRNIALKYMMIADDEKHFELAATQQSHATNMTNEIAALQVIANSNQTSQSEYIDKFYQKWQKEDLVLDKWFSAQVLKDDDNIISHIKTLMDHEKFSTTNPNKVRSLIGAFVANNLPQFHHASGQGYEFLASFIIHLNQINPQVSARLAKQFNQWKKFDGKRQAIIQTELERIMAVENLSKDVFEVVDKTLKM